MRLHGVTKVRILLALPLVLFVWMPSSAGAQRLLREHVGDSVPLQNGGFWGEFVNRTLPMGDLNGDGFDDYVLIGRKNRFWSGWYEFRSGDDGRLLAPRFEQSTPSTLARNLVPVGDFNGDGRPDVVRTDSDFTCEVVDLWDGSLIAPLPWSGAPVAFYGDKIVPLGDINGDGFDDVAIGSNTPNEIGVHLGPTGVLTQELSSYGGLELASPGDLNGDGVSDLLLGNAGAGVVVAISCSDFSVIYAIGAATGCRCTAAYFGQTIAPLSDLDGDGVRDFAVAAPAATFSISESGRAFLEFRSGRTGDFIRRVDEPFPRLTEQFPGVYVVHDLGSFGLRMHSHGDFNGDGYDDLVVSSPRRFDSLDANNDGADSIVSGRTGEILADVIALGQTESSVRLLGQEAYMLGDLDGDGLAEFSTGVVQDDQGGPESGRVFIYRGSRGDAVPYCPPLAHSGGGAARLHLDGSLSLLNEDMWVQVYEGLPGALCLFYASPGEHTSPTGPNLLCLGGSGLVRLAPPTVIRPDGLGEVQMDFLSSAAAGGWLPGTTWTMQAIFRDPLGAKPLGRSNAIVLEWGH